MGGFVHVCVHVGGLLNDGGGGGGGDDADDDDDDDDDADDDGSNACAYLPAATNGGCGRKKLK